jgi:glutamate racemase
VQQIERGELDSAATRRILETALHPMLDRGIDTIVLGCTHYPFVIPLIQEIAGPEVRVIDPAPAVARQAARLLESSRLQRADSQPAILQLFTSGNADRLRVLLPRLSEESGEVQEVRWDGLKINLPQR